MHNRTQYLINFNYTIEKLKNNKNAILDIHRQKDYAHFHKQFLILNKRKITPTAWFNKVTSLLDAMLAKNLLPTALIFSEIINGLGRLGFFIYLEKILAAAITRDINPGFLYNASFTALAQNKSSPMSLALRLFNQAVANKAANSYTYKAIIDVVAMSISPSYTLAIELLEQAKAAGMANTSVYLSAIDAIARSTTPDTDLALELIAEANLTLPTPMRTTRLDLFDLSFGMAYFYLKIKFTEFLQNNQNHVTIDYSTGTKSHFEMNILEAATLKIIGEIKSYGLPVHAVENNNGEISITLGMPLLNHSPKLFRSVDSRSSSTATISDEQKKPSYTQITKSTP